MSVEIASSPPRSLWRAELAPLLLGIPLAAGLLALGLPELRAGLLPDLDDSMRLVEVRDFLAGQSWFDLTQYRLEPPQGLLMHWSRLVDVPLAALVLLFRAVLGTQGAELAMLALWPVALLFPALWLEGRIGARLGVSPLLAAGLFAVSVAPFAIFPPGRIDHHNVQLVATLALLALLLGGPGRSGHAAGAGLCAAVMLAIGMETLPLVMAAGLAAAFLWGWYGETYRDDALAFGLAFPAATAALFVGTVPASHWLVPACDALSDVQTVAAAVGGLGLAAAAALVRGSRGTRFLSLAGLAAVLAAVLALTAPACLAGPFAALDPRVVRFWLADVPEARNIVELLRTDPTVALVFAFPLAGLGGTLWALRLSHGDTRRAWALVLLFLATALAVAFFSCRQAPFAQALAAPGAAFVILRLRDRLGGANPARRAAAFVLPLLLVNNMSAAALAATLKTEPAPGSRPETGKAFAQCASRAALARVAALPPGLILAPIDLGTPLLAHTPHGVLAAPYHRSHGIVDAVESFMGSPDEAQAIVRRRGVRYVVTCAGLKELTLDAERTPDGLAARLAHGDVPDWLEALPDAGSAPLQVYRVTP